MSGSYVEGKDFASERIGAEAVDWVERADREDWNEEARTALEKWLALSTAHTVAYLRAKDGWKRADRVTCTS